MAPPPEPSTIPLVCQHVSTSLKSQGVVDASCTKVTDDQAPTMSTVSSFAALSLDLRIDDAKKWREALHSSFLDTCHISDALYSHLTEEAFYQRADPLRHPLIFYFGHTAVFYINKMVLAKNISWKNRINPKIESLMAVGVDEMSWDDLLSDDYPWPSVKEVKEYRSQTRQLVSNYILNHLDLSDNTTVHWNHPAWIFLMSIEHERIHLETSSVLLRHLPLTCFVPNLERSVFISRQCETMETAFEKFSSSNRFHNRWILFDSKEKIRLGRRAVFDGANNESIKKDYPWSIRYHDSYGWDNEYGELICDSKSFFLSSKFISNGDYLSFILDGGYSQSDIWSEEGWKWVSFTKSKWPRFWVHDKFGGITRRSALQDMSIDSKRLKPEEFRLRLLFQETREMPWDWPVEVNALEASAYCRWLTKRSNVLVRLPTEEEYGVALYQICQDNPSILISSQNGHSLSPILESNTALKYTSPCPVDWFPHGKPRSSSHDIFSLTGNVWHWMRTAMAPFVGFSPHHFYDDFTLPTFDDRHNVIKGGSFISCGNEVLPFARYAFRRHFYQHAGFRVCATERSLSDGDLVGRVAELSQRDPLNSSSNMTLSRGSSDQVEAYKEDVDAKNVANADHLKMQSVPSVTESNAYESDRLVNEYIDFHFGTASRSQFNDVANFPTICATVCLGLAAKCFYPREHRQSPLKMLDIGCAVGRSSFELAIYGDQVVGMDFSARFIQVANKLKEQSHAPYAVIVEGEVMEYKDAALGSAAIPLDGKVGDAWLLRHFGENPLQQRTSLSISDICKSVSFSQGDACNLPTKNGLLNDLHVVLAANLIDRLYDPLAFLSMIHERLVKGGLLILTSPYTWLEQFTPKEAWIGGKKIDGENITTLEALEILLQASFLPVCLPDIFPQISIQVEGQSRNAFSLPFVIRETERKYQFSFAQVSVWKRL